MSAVATIREISGVCPLDCPDTCSWVVTVRDGEAVALRGDRRHPYTRGALCAKVNRFLEHTRQPDRLLYPMRRVGAKGEGRFERITWDAALGEIASRWRAIIASDGPQAIWPYYGTGSLGMLQGLAGCGRRLWNALGTSQIHLSICMSAGGVGTGLTLGDNRVGMDPEGIAEARLVLLWGANPLVTHHHLWKYVEAARGKGAHVVVIDPIRSRTADRADEHLAPHPGTDAALALGLLHVVVSRGAEDREFIEPYTVGWEAFRERILEYPPARVAAITGLPVERIEALGARIASARPTAIRIGPGHAAPCRRRHGGARDHLHPRGHRRLAPRRGRRRLRHPGVLQGQLGRALARRPAPARHAGHPDDAARRGAARAERPARAVAAGLRRQSRRQRARPEQGPARPRARGPLHGGDRPLPDGHRGFRRLLLPATMQTEHADLHIAYGHFYVAWNEPAVTPPGECLPNSEIFRRLARALEVAEPSVYDADEDLARAVLDSADLRLSGITLPRLKTSGFLRMTPPAPFAPFAKGFPTPSGRLEFFSERAAALGLDPLPAYSPPAEAAPATRPSAGATRWPWSPPPAPTSSTPSSRTTRLCATRPGPSASSCIPRTRRRAGSPRGTRSASTTTGASSGPGSR